MEFISFIAPFVLGWTCGTTMVEGVFDIMDERPIFGTINLAFGIIAFTALMTVIDYV